MLIKISDLLIQNSNGENPPIVTQKKIPLYPMDEEGLFNDTFEDNCYLTKLRSFTLKTFTSSLVPFFSAAVTITSSPITWMIDLWLIVASLLSSNSSSVLNCAMYASFFQKFDNVDFPICIDHRRIRRKLNSF
jgi:hypothetical protein